MNVIIIEDEPLAQAKLESMLVLFDSSIRILAKLSSVKDSLQWLSKNASPDVAFVDIQLSDDHSFEIFRQHPITFPIIFTTAFDKYILESFEFNSIDYLLKPISYEKLKRSLEKIKNLKQHFSQENITHLIANTREPGNRNRIVAKKGTEFIALDPEDIAYFYTEHKIVFVRDFSGRKLIINKNLGELEHDLDPKKFFRINRKFIVHAKAIERYKPDKGKILLFLQPDVNAEIHVSKETAPDFRKWITG